MATRSKSKGKKLGPITVTRAPKRRKRSKSRKTKNNGSKLHEARNLILLIVMILAVLKGVDLANAASEMQTDLGRQTITTPDHTPPTASVAGAEATVGG